MKQKKFLLSAILMSVALGSVFAQNTNNSTHQTTTLSPTGQVQWRIDDKPDYTPPPKSADTAFPVVKKKSVAKKKNTPNKTASVKKPAVNQPPKQTAAVKPPEPEKPQAKQVEKKPPVPANKVVENKKGAKPAPQAHKWKKPVLALDAGYSINDPGMAGVRGKREVEYNDRFVAELIPKIKAAGWEVKLTRGDYGYVSDKHRAEQANIWEADLLLSIHHDVSPKRFLKTETKDGVTVNQSTKSFEGYSMYVSKRNKKYRASLCFAQRLGFRLKPLQRDPAYFHKEHDGLPLIMKEYGIYERDIPLLREADIPAVQVKIGVVTDPQDEAWINDDQYRRDIENAVIKTIRVFKQYCSYW